MAKILVFTVLFLGGMAHGQALNEIAQEGHAIGSKQTPERRLLHDQKEVWNEERNYFRYLRQKDLKSFMSLWDDNFVGWPDYSDHPLKKKNIESGIREEFQSVQTPGPPIPAPIPEEIEVFGTVAVTHYFWPEANETSPVKYRVMHTWQKGAQGWHIIGGMDCEVPGSAQSTPLAPATSHHQQPLPKSDDKAAVEATVRGYEEAVQQFDFAKADPLLARNAKWIERSAPEAAAASIGGPIGSAHPEYMIILPPRALNGPRSRLLAFTAASFASA